MLTNDQPQMGLDSVCLYDAAHKMIEALRALEQAKVAQIKAKEAYLASQSNFSVVWRNSSVPDTILVVEVGNYNYVIQVSHEDGAIDGLFYAEKIVKPEGSHE